MNNVPTELDPNSNASCPICQGSGEVVYIDEEVGCRVVQPCWRCGLSSGEPAPLRHAED